MYDLPTSIFIDGTEYKIRNAGDFRMVIDCFSALGDIEMGEDYRILASLIIFYEDFNDIDDIPKDEKLLVSLVKEMYIFFNQGQEEEDRQSVKPKLIDWDKDAQLIMAAVNKVAQRELRLEPYVHWWTFIGYYMAIGESVLSTVVSIRDKILKGSKMEKWEKEYQRDNPQFFKWNSKTIEEQELDALVNELWNNGE